MALRLALQYALPAKLLSALVRAATRWRFRAWKNLLIGAITRAYGIALEEAASAERDDYPHFNAFFTRALKPGARVPDPDPAALLMPADGRISQLGRIRAGAIFQAKGHEFSAAELLADAAAAASFRDGWFATIYLSPRDYHRVHMPFGGRLIETVHVPGRLFSVAPFTVAAIPRLFARNERLVCHFETSFGQMAVVMVGAMLVSGVETVWGGIEIPPYARSPRRRRYDQQPAPPELARFAEMGRFNMGSTVIVLLPDAVRLAEGLRAGDPVRLGQRLGTVARPGAF